MVLINQTCGIKRIIEIGHVHTKSMEGILYLFLLKSSETCLNES